ncbi:hypothetical protein AWB83_02183 [Caballeronia ptereochthonis]|uniref:Uncharacterized protein n=1 Tax=Caballeronia ptereochthonis TaxID=1777144 RepID=A0A158AS58_9BURK|nr:hypothetical protein AWB83_02183 [Caballeronia ptereochthonis]
MSVTATVRSLQKHTFALRRKRLTSTTHTVDVNRD